MSNRFDLEEAIMRCWNVTEDLKLVSEVQNPVEYVEALQKVYEQKFENLFNIFEQCIKQGVAQ